MPHLVLRDWTTTVLHRAGFLLFISKNSFYPGTEYLSLAHFESYISGEKKWKEAWGGGDREDTPIQLKSKTKRHYLKLLLTILFPSPLPWGHQLVPSPLVPSGPAFLALK